MTKKDSELKQLENEMFGSGPSKMANSYEKNLDKKLE